MVILSEFKVNYFCIVGMRFDWFLSGAEDGCFCGWGRCCD